MDGNSSERGRHRHRAHTEKPPAVENPQWTAPSSDRPQWTPPQQATESWFEKRDEPDGDRWRQAAADNASRWRPVSDLTDTAWGVDGAWHDPAAQWNVAAGDAGPTPTPAAPLPAAPRQPAAPARPAAPRQSAAPARPAAPRQPGAPSTNGPAAPEQRGAPLESPFDTADGWRDTDWAGWNGDTWASGEPTDAAWRDSVDEPAAAVGLLERPPAADEPPARTHVVRHPLRLGLFALVLFGLVAGSVAWMSMDKSVQLSVDGQARSIKTYASTVGGVLDDQKITVGQHDTLAPSRETKVSDGAEIVLRRGRLVTLTVDGKPRAVWTTATTVQEALEQVGYRQNGLFVSANRSTRLPLEGYQLTLRTPKTVTFLADGKKYTVTTTVPTVGEAMDAAGVSVDGDDRVSQLAGTSIVAGMTVTVTRVKTTSTTTQTVIEYKSVEKTDPKATPGSRTVKTKGVNGLQQVTHVLTYVNGKLTSNKVAKVTVVKKPVDEVVVVGPEPPEGASPPPGGSTQPAECADFPTSGGLNWCGLAKCESGLNPSAYNPAGPYYGLYQFDQQTWTANGGSGSPSGKSIAEQTAVAYSLYQARGASPWPVCGKNL
jgi:uncharacterized protein YabE (DUF348 family)